MSSEDRSVILHQAASLESMNFDRFILGATLAACAYLAQTIPFAPLGYNIETMYLWSLIVTGFAAFLGFKRIEAVVEMTKHNSIYLGKLETRQINDQHTHDAYRVGLEIRSSRTLRYYKARNAMLLMSFVCYIFTKVFSTYLI